MEWLKELNEAISGLVWGIPMLALIVGVGVYLSFRTHFVQIFRFRYAMKNTIGKAFSKQKSSKGDVTPFQALTTALASTVGTGNIAGITSAVTLGGAGSIFWLWVSAVIGMCTKYAEVVLAVRFRERNKAGEWAGGPMYYIKNGLGKNFEWLAAVFCVFGAVAAFGVGNAVQVGNMTGSINSAVQAFIPGAGQYKSTINLTVGIIVALLTALTLFGGIKRIGRVTEVLVPLMAAVYIIASLVVIVVNIDCLGAVFAKIFNDAFSPAAAAGGAAGISVRTAVSWGFRRGVFSNEAGLGSAPIAHATTSETNPVKQGMFGIFEVFLDTIVMCTITGLTLLMSGIDINYGSNGSIALNISAFATVFGGKAAGVIIAVGMSMFALATVLGWSLYGVRCAEYLFGSRSIPVYQFVYVLVTVAGATLDLDFIWQVADTLNGLMAIPNLIAVLALSGVVVKLTREHFDRLDRQGNDKSLYRRR
ncbi:alanine or glycine:cation symporter, AGCS family [Sporobacter termitidis DSM 10068]|uniref:Alanine or glycine:cation symporter, AGCS family n=1 Tax=Sporobacter termitidis DSM 10068 TaxID=1123282 RepID=A0A1M5U7P8_9FIRM|nr:sodium:alanine symporter family protein [Sporobacter termitidis]SHH58979.1 alanine or glycine:cation symporter, AGCS family [Sporobacter termitidis DSM 10068]